MSYLKSAIVGVLLFGFAALIALVGQPAVALADVTGIWVGTNYASKVSGPVQV